MNLTDYILDGLSVDQVVDQILQERHFRGSRGRKYVKLSPASMTLAAVATGAGLVLWDKIQKLMTSFFISTLQDRDSRDKVDSILQDAIVKIGDVVKPHMKPFMTELQSDMTSGKFKNMSPDAFRRHLATKVTEHLTRSMAHIDPILNEMNNQLKGQILSHVRNEMLNFLFREDI